MREFIVAHKTFFVGLLITAATPLLMTLTTLDPAQLTDVRAWAVGVGAATVRQVAAYIVTKLAL